MGGWVGGGGGGGGRGRGEGGKGKGGRGEGWKGDIISSLPSSRVAVTRSQDIPYFGPHIPEGGVFDKNEHFKEFFLAKCTMKNLFACTI